MQDQHDLSNINMDSDFAEALHGIIFEKRPVKIIETGTYHGTGTTAIIAKALEQCKIENAVFYSIEVNPENVKQALLNLQKQHVLHFVKILNGLSIPRNLLPGTAEIEEKCVNHIEFPNLYIDHHKQERVKKYHEETNWESLPDDLLGKCLKEFNDRPDFVLLDSAGHIGNIEFNYLIERLKSECMIALDDTYHIKHHKSLLQIQEDPRFCLLVNSKERTGFCIARFNPVPESKQTNGPATVFLSELIKEGESLFAQGKTVEAIQCFQDVLDRDPKNGTALNNLGVMAFQLNDLQLAENFLVKAVRLNRRDPESIANLANLYAQQGNLLNARALVAEARAGGLILSDLDPLLQVDDQPQPLESVDEK